MAKILKSVYWRARKSAAYLKSSLQPKKVYCFCCEKKSHAFLPYGLVKRENALCPVCGSLERHRLHWYYMKNNTNLFNSPGRLKVLHVAPEKVFYDKFVNDPKFEYTPCAKFGEGYYDTYPAGTVNIDITAINFEDDSFDVIYCSHVLEHVDEDIMAMREFLRVLKPDGWAMLQVPIHLDREKTYEDFSITEPMERERVFGQSDHVRIYGKDYKDRLEAAGFKVKVERCQEFLSEAELLKYGFINDEDIYLCTKN